MALKRMNGLLLTCKLSTGMSIKLGVRFWASSFRCSFPWDPLFRLSTWLPDKVISMLLLNLVWSKGVKEKAGSVWRCSLSENVITTYCIFHFSGEMYNFEHWGQSKKQIKHLLTRIVQQQDNFSENLHQKRGDPSRRWRFNSERDALKDEAIVYLYWITDKAFNRTREKCVPCVTASKYFSDENNIVGAFAVFLSLALQQGE